MFLVLCKKKKGSIILNNTNYINNVKLIYNKLNNSLHK